MCQEGGAKRSLQYRECVRVCARMCGQEAPDDVASIVNMCMRACVWGCVVVALRVVAVVDCVCLYL